MFYAPIAHEAVQQARNERKALRRHYNSYDEATVFCAWEDAHDAYDQANFCRYLLCEPEQAFERGVK